MTESNQSSGDWPAVPSMARRAGDKCWCDDEGYATCARDCEVRRQRDRYREALVEATGSLAGASEAFDELGCQVLASTLHKAYERASEALGR